MFQRNDIRLGIFWRMVEVVGAEFFAFCSFLLLTRLLAPEHFGVVALATLLVLVAQLVLCQGIGEALVQKDGIDEGYYSSALWMNVVLALIVTLGLIFGSSWIADFFSKPSFGPVLSAIAPLLLLYALSGILQAKLRRDLKLRGFAFASIIATICGAATAAVMALSGFEVWSLVGQQWSYMLISTTMFLYHAHWWPKLSVASEHLRALLVFSVNTIGTALLRFSLRQVDLLFLGFYLSSTEVGLYFLATRILNTVGQLTYYSIQKIGLPVLSRLQNDPIRHRAAIISTLRLTCLICLPVFFGMAIAADRLVPLLFGESWIDSIPPFRLLCLFSIFYALSLITNQILLSGGLSGTVLRLSALNAVLFFTAAAFAAPHGITATALAGGAANALCLPVYFLVLRRRLGVDLTPLLRELLPIFGAAIAMAAAVISSRHHILGNLHPLIDLGLSALLGALVFIGVIAWLRRDIIDQAVALIRGERQSDLP